MQLPLKVWTAAVTLLATALASPAAADPPRANQATQAETSDPLFDALRELQREIESMRREVRQLGGTANSTAGAAQVPKMEASMPAMPSSNSPAPQDLPAIARPVPATTTARSLFADATVVPAQEIPEPFSLWSFQPLKPPAVPTARLATWPRNDIDRFVAARREAAGLQANPDADRYTLIRRLAFDLTGLPPTVGEIEAFVNDSDSDDQALAKVVDRYLGSERFGERWARHWLDVVRYADSVGRTWNAPFTHAWRYRDYVIDAFNQDMPYNRFIVEQIAGDLLPAVDAQQRRTQIIATGLLTLGSVDIQEGRYEPYLLERVDDQLDVTTRAFLGLSVSCARCHDHKYDPVSIRDYYALAGIFYSSRTFSGQGILSERVANGYVDYQRLLPLNDGGNANIATGAAAGNPKNLPEVRSMAEYQTQWTAGHRDIRYAFDDLAMGVTEGQVRDCELRIKGEPYDRGPAPPRGHISIPGMPRLEPIPADQSGRLQYARWIVSPGNPLPARVMANRVWQHLFGQGLVRTVDDFGTVGEEPTHPELLDYLATQFQEQGWSVKNLIRMIVLSRVYRQGSQGNAANEAVDPQNHLLWRMNLRRLELEPLRDSLLHFSGRLRTDRPVGIPVAGTGGRARQSMTHSLLPIDAPYRTVYLPVLRSLLPEMYDIFDFPNPTQIAGQRYVTTVAPQALFLMNSSFSQQCAENAAEQLQNDEPRDEDSRIAQAYLRLLGRPASGQEVAVTREFLQTLRPANDSRDAELYRWTLLVQAMFGSAEFSYLK